MSEDLKISPEALGALRSLRAEKKFLSSGLYPGAPTEQIRLASEGAVNEMLDRLLLALSRPASKSFLLSEFLLLLKQFEGSDTEEREQACSYCEDVMDIVGVKSSDGVLNQWLYGFDPCKSDGRDRNSE